MVTRTSSWCSEHHYGTQNIIMVVRTSLWCSDHHYGGQNILWWSEHHYGTQNIIMVDRTALWCSVHHYGAQTIIMVVNTELPDQCFGVSPLHLLCSCTRWGAAWRWWPWCSWFWCSCRTRHILTRTGSPARTWYCFRSTDQSIHPSTVRREKREGEDYYWDCGSR